MTPAIPFAASMTTRSGLIAATSTNERTRSTYFGQTSYGWTCPLETCSGAWHRDMSVSAMARSRTSSRPDSLPTGRAPRRTSFTPVYSFGLCEAVTIAPPSSPSEPTAK